MTHAQPGPRPAPRRFLAKLLQFPHPLEDKAMLDSCGLCGESYDEDNLARCTQCGRDYCYKCGSLGVCDRCREKKEQAEAGSPGPAI